MIIEKERLISRYMEALFAGDFDAQVEIVAEAEEDAALMRELWETNVAVGDDLTYVAQANEVRLMVAGALGAPVLTGPEKAAAATEEDRVAEDPLLLSDVASQLRSDIVRGAVRVPDREAALKAADTLSRRQETLTEEALSERGARTLLHNIGIRLGRWFEDIFHGVAFDMEMGRRENIRLSAARRARFRQERSGNGEPKDQTHGE